MFASPALYAIIAAVLLSIGAVGGWAIKSWKDGAEVAHIESKNARLESRISILETANGNCAMDIEGVRNGVAIVVP